MPEDVRPEGAPASQWVWDPAASTYHWWDGERYTIVARCADGEWSYAPAPGVVQRSLDQKPGSAARHERHFGMAAAIAGVAAMVAFGAFLTGVDPGPDETPDTGSLEIVIVVAGIVFTVAGITALIELVLVFSMRRDDE